MMNFFGTLSLLALDINPAPGPSGTAVDIGAQTSLGNETPVNVISYGINWVLTVLGFLFLLFMLYGGFIWMKARGNEEEVTKAKKIIEAAVVGVLLILASYGVTSFIFKYIVNITNAN